MPRPSTRPQPGDAIEWKPARGLGGWRRGEFVRWDGERVAVVRAGGREHEVPARHVRPQTAPRPRPPARIVPAELVAQGGAVVHRDPKPENALRTLSPEELERVPVPSREQIRAANEAAARVAAALRARRRLPGRPVPKPATPFRSPAWLDRVRALPCCHCGAPAPSEPHHFGPRGMGQKTSDLFTAPLCESDHRAWHDTGALPGLSREESENVLLRAQRDLMAAHIVAAEVL